MLAHSLRLADGGVLKKGTRLTDIDVVRLQGAGFDAVVVAREGPGDVSEGAAARTGEAVTGPGVRVDRARTGRCNLYAARPGLLHSTLAGSPP